MGELKEKLLFTFTLIRRESETNKQTNKQIYVKMKKILNCFFSFQAVIDYENWILDLQRSNKNKSAKWGKSYSAKDEYKMKSLSPKDWHDLYEKMKKDENLFNLYYRYIHPRTHAPPPSPTSMNINTNNNNNDYVYYRHSHKDSPQINPSQCDNKCKQNVLCRIKSCLKYKD